MSPATCPDDETLDGRDALTEAIARGSFPSGDEEVLCAAIEQAKRLIDPLHTVGMDKTDADYVSASGAVSVQYEKSRYKLDFLAPAEQPDELGRLVAMNKQRPILDPRHRLAALSCDRRNE
jgi:hypothetical protein